MTSDSNSELRIRLAVACYRFPQKYKLLAEWLGVYEYILPDKRELGPAIEVHINGPFNCFMLWQFMDMLYVCFTYDEQVMIWKLIRESSTYLTPVYLPCIPAPGSFKSIA